MPSPKPERLEHEMNEAVQKVGEVLERVVNAMDAELQKSNVTAENFDEWLQEAKELQSKRREALETEYEQRRQQTSRRWKRY